MWWLKKKRSGDQVRTLTSGGVLDEQTFWQIVRAEKERADRSGVPVTVAIFTVSEDATCEHSLTGWNAAALSSILRSTSRLTDYVGIAGESELGVVLWGTRELGAYRFVNRLGEKGEKLAADCKLFVYPALTGDLANSKSENGDKHKPQKTKSGHSILDRISDVEQQIAQAMEIETPVADDDDVGDYDDSYGFGSGNVNDSQSRGGDGDRTAVLATSSPAAVATRNKVDTQKTLDELLANNLGVRLVTDTLGDVSPKEERKQDSKLNVLTEPLENLFLVPHPFWKRTVDVVGALGGLLVLGPVLAAVAGFIKATSPGPVLFTQLREGHGSTLFTIYKFRTMRVGADAEKAELRATSEQDGPAFKMEQDPRITPLGSFLRKTCLDELPQLWNVLIGDMTLVGPRPLDYRESSQIARWGRRRLHVMPGLTCIWQVHGKSKVTFNEWMRMDIRYSQKVSFWQDIKLVLATLRQVVLRKASH